MKRLHMNHWCIGLALSAAVFASAGCVEDGPPIPVLQGVRGPSALPPADAGEDSGAAGSAMPGSGGSGQGGSGQGGASMGGTGPVDGGADATTDAG